MYITIILDILIINKYQQYMNSNILGVKNGITWIMTSKINLKFYRETMESSGWTMTTSGESIATWLCVTCLQTSITMGLATEQVSNLVVLPLKSDEPRF